MKFSDLDKSIEGMDKDAVVLDALKDVLHDVADSMKKSEQFWMNLAAVYRQYNEKFENASFDDVSVKSPVKKSSAADLLSSEYKLLGFDNRWVYAFDEVHKCHTFTCKIRRDMPDFADFILKDYKKNRLVPEFFGKLNENEVFISSIDNIIIAGNFQYDRALLEVVFPSGVSESALKELMNKYIIEDVFASYRK